jgi:gluconate 5-dehydrogenase
MEAGRVNLFDLSGRTALVTGSSRGLGFAIAEGLARAGAELVLNGIDGERLRAAAAGLAAAGTAVHAAPFDVTDEASVEAAFGRLDAAGIEVSILVNNAGIQLRKALVDLAAAEWRRVIETNLTSAVLVGRAAARRMIARGKGGKIINVGSVMSAIARPTVAPYTAAKGGLKLLTRAMAAEWAAHGIQANAIGPGYMLTDMTRALAADAAFDAWVKGRTPSRRWGRPDDLVGTAVYLASPASDYVNGQIVYVDGGLTAVL